MWSCSTPSRHLSHPSCGLWLNGVTTTQPPARDESSSCFCFGREALWPRQHGCGGILTTQAFLKIFFFLQYPFCLMLSVVHSIWFMWVAFFFFLHQLQIFRWMLIHGPLEGFFLGFNVKHFPHTTSSNAQSFPFFSLQASDWPLCPHPPTAKKRHHLMVWSATGNPAFLSFISSAAGRGRRL